MKKIVCTAAMCALGISVPAAAISIDGTFTSSALVYEEHPTDSTDDTQFDVYEGLRFTVRDVGHPSVSLHAHARASSIEPTTEVYALWLGVRAARGLADVRAGRQFVHVGHASGPMDALYADVNPNRYIRLTGFFGAPVDPLDNGNVQDVGDESYWAARAATRALVNTDFGVSFSQRHEAGGLTQEEIGFDALLVRPERGCRFEARAVYDVLNSELDLFRALAAPRFSQKIIASLDYRYRRPRLRSSSMFSVFEADPYHDVALSGTYFVSPATRVFGTLGYTSFTDESAMRARLGVGWDDLSFGVYTESGYGGPRTGAFGSYGLRPAGWLRLDANVDLSSFRLDDELRDDGHTAAVGTLAGTASLTENLIALVEFELSRDDVFAYDSRVFGSLTWRFAAGGER